VTDERDFSTELEHALASSGEPLDGAARSRIRKRVMADVRASRVPLWRAFAMRRFAAAATALTVLGGGTAYAANQAMPGDMLYGLKRAGENAVVALLPHGNAEQRILAGLAARRAEETAHLARQGASSQALEESMTRLREALREATAEGAELGIQEQQRIHEYATDAPEPVRSEIRRSVDEPGTGEPRIGPAPGTDDPAGDDSSAPGTGNDTAPGPGSGDGDGSGDGSGSGDGPAGGSDPPGPGSGSLSDDGTQSRR